MRTYAKLVGCVKLSQPATPDGDICTSIDHDELVAQLEMTNTPPALSRRGALHRLDMKNLIGRKKSSSSVASISTVHTPTHQVLMQSLLQAGITNMRTLCGATVVKLTCTAERLMRSDSVSSVAPATLPQSPSLTKMVRSNLSALELPKISSTRPLTPFLTVTTANSLATRGSQPDSRKSSLSTHSASD